MRRGCEVYFGEDLSFGDGDAIDAELHGLELSIVGHNVDAWHAILVLLYFVAVFVPSVSVCARVTVG